MATSIQKGLQFINYTRSSDRRLNTFISHSNLTLSAPNSTRWNPWHNALKRLLKCKDSVNHFIASWAPETTPFLLTQEDWLLIQQTIDFLQPFQEATLKTQGDYNTLDLMQLTMDFLNKHLHSSEATQNDKKIPPLALLSSIVTMSLINTTPSLTNHLSIQLLSFFTLKEDSTTSTEFALRAGSNQELTDLHTSSTLNTETNTNLLPKQHLIQSTQNPLPWSYLNKPSKLPTYLTSFNTSSTPLLPMQKTHLNGGSILPSKNNTHVFHTWVLTLSPSTSCQRTQSVYSQDRDAWLHGKEHGLEHQQLNVMNVSKAGKRVN
jgi:hypothetical protein